MMKTLGKYLSLWMLVLAAATFALPRHFIHTTLIEHAEPDEHANAHLDHTDCASCECSLSNGLEVYAFIPPLAPSLHVEPEVLQAWPEVLAFRASASMRGPPALA